MTEIQIKNLIKEYEKEYIEFMEIEKLPQYKIDFFEINVEESDAAGFASAAQAYCCKYLSLNTWNKSPVLSKYEVVCEENQMNKKSYWLSISMFVLILIWTVYYYAMRYTGGFADLKDRVICGAVALICVAFIVKRTIDFLKNKKS